MKKDLKIPNYPKIYKVVEVRPDGKEIPTGVFRVRKKVKIKDRWTTRVETFNSFDEAKRFSKSLFVERPNLETKVSTPTFKDVLGRYFLYIERRKLGPGTIDGYRNRSKHLKFFEPMRVIEITAKTIDAWLNLIAEPVYLKAQQSTRLSYDHELILLGAILRFYREYENEHYNHPILKRHRELGSAGKSKQEDEIRYLSSAQEALFLEALNSKPMLYDFAILQLDTGLRVGEAAALEFKSVDFASGEIKVAQHLHWVRRKGTKIEVLPGTKTGPNRIIPLTSRCLQMLKMRRAFSSGKVFEGKNGSWLPYRAIQGVYEKVFKNMGVDHHGTHTLRHTFAVRFLDQTKDIYALQKLMGHSDLKVTLQYAKYTYESVRKSFQLFRGGKEAEVAPMVQNLVQNKTDNFGT